MTRAKYLFPLAHLCGSPPPVVDAMGVSDFANLVTGITEYQKAQAAQGAGAI